MHSNYVEALVRHCIKNVSINVPANQLGTTSKQINESIFELIEKVHKAGIDPANGLALMLVMGNPAGGKAHADGKNYNIFQHIENVIKTLTQEGLDGKVDLYTGLYPTGYFDYVGEKTGSRWSNRHFSKQMSKVEHISKQGYPGFRGYMTQMTFHPKLAADFAHAVLMRCARDQNLFLGFTSKTDTMFATKVIRTHLSQMTGDKAYAHKDSLCELIFYTLARLPAYNVLLSKMQAGSLDMLWRFWYSKSQNAARMVYLFYDELQRMCDKDSLARTHVHWNTGYQLPSETATFACEAAAAKILAYQRYFINELSSTTPLPS